MTHPDDSAKPPASKRELEQHVSLGNGAILVLVGADTFWLGLQGDPAGPVTLDASDLQLVGEMFLRMHQDVQKRDGVCGACGYKKADA